MSMETRFTREHEWVRLDGQTATIGITSHAQEALGDVVFVELPEPGRDVEAGEAVAVVESVKAASDVYSALPGKVVAANTAIVDDPARVNREADGDAWFFKIDVTDTAAFTALMDRESYDHYLESL